MYARLVSGRVPPDKLDEAIEVFRAAIVPAMKCQPGNRGGRLLTDRSTGKLVTISLWESEAHERAGASSGYVDEQLAKVAHLFVDQPALEHYQVAIRRSQPRGSFLRMTTLTIRPDRLEEAIAAIRDVATIVTEQPGSHGLALLVDPTTGKARVSTIWETAEDMEAGESNGFYQEQRAKMLDFLTEPPPPGEHYEVSVSVVSQ